MYQYEDVRAVHLEITQRCQAGCPLCGRHDGDPINPYLTMAELSLEDCKKIFKPSFLEQLNRIYMCGNFGDPIIAHDTLEIFKYFRSINSTMWLDMYTNAGARNVEWWQELAKTMGENGTVIFSVDGLKDTNHIYRQNVNWEIVERSMRAFRDADGIARWDYIIFEHNKHQIEEARAFAKELGFDFFQIKKSDRFWNHKTLVAEPEKGPIKQPTEKKYHNKSLKTEQVIEQYGSVKNYYDQTKIVCKVLGEKSVYISAEGLCLPCCWTASRLYRGRRPAGSQQIWNFVNDTGGKENINAINNDIEDIINRNGMFGNIKNSWSCSSIEKGKLDVCAEKCGTELPKCRASIASGLSDNRFMLIGQK